MSIDYMPFVFFWVKFDKYDRVNAVLQRRRQLYEELMASMVC